MSKPAAYVVTGAGSGIGQALSQTIARHGHQVFGIGRSAEKLARTADLADGHFIAIAADLAEPESTATAVQAIHSKLETLGMELKGLVNNAGVYDFLSFANSGDEIWERQFQNNLMSAVRLTRALHTKLANGAPSSVLNISSTLGLKPIANTSAYSAMKAAMVNWTLALAGEWAASKIRVNCICPGLVDTPIHSFHGKPEAEQARVAAHGMQPLGRMGRPEDIAAAAWFLLSDESSWTTGTVMNLDGGISL